MKHIAVIVALGVLSGCGTQGIKSGDKADAPYKDMLKKPLLADSIMRDGDDLSYQVQVTLTNNLAVPDIAQLQASCTTPSGNLLYLEAPGTPKPDGQPTRITVMRNLTPAVVGELQQNTSFTDACARTPRPDWRLVSSTATQRQLLIDRASLKTVGEKVELWGAYDEPLILTNKLKKMPYAQTRMHWEVSCSRQTYRTLATFSLTPKNVVTFGSVVAVPIDQPFSSAETDTQTLLKAACSPTVAQLPVAVARTKLEQTLTPAPVPTAVTEAISALGMPPAAKPLRHLMEKRDLGSSSLRTDVFIEPGTGNGQLKIRRATQFSSTHITTFRGLFSLTFQSDFELHGMKVSAASNVEQLSFTGDWKQMPIGATLGFKLKELNRNTAEEDRVLSRNTTCVVARELPASSINSTLSGNAKELNCTAAGDNYQATSTVMYLKDYGYFFATEDVIQGKYKTHTTLINAQ
ncbi:MULTISPECIES: hypothetical protein [Pseudomonas]|uniref:Lipoprotein n=1 Tax=Pseudomonas tritici TaxID=2745518 RepID=A0A8I0CVS9_9PSED|nr:MULTISPECIES: hypothetical protein [Pseudomonas]MBP2872319.1 hypothetical protein [Pseudomonas sp. SWRI144]MBW8129333.1 hypothetical protein [Pseudomonas sp. LAP_36]MBW8138286.1 hypothetical protein [Pseudomonas sp. PAMC 26818]QXH84521.1 hypothetical protein HU722_0003255 [Pseudomonas tritici]CRL98237.1 hypothetical protein [Pseudomonas sp. 24 E 1]